MGLKLIFQVGLMVIFSEGVLAQTVANYPATEIYMLDIQKKGSNFSIAQNAHLINISKNKGYDNQPSFIEKMHSIAYVSSRNNKPPDVYLYDLEAESTKQLTNNDEAEFSPKITPDGKFISVVKGGEQNLTRISLDGSVTEKLYTSKDSIGYYCWLDKKEIAAFVLSNPITLKLIDIENKTEKYLADSIGRSLFKYSDGILTCRILHSGNSVTYVNRAGKCKQWIQLPAGTEDFYLTGDGWLFSSNGASIVYCNADKINEGWHELANLKDMGISKIFRLSVNRKTNKLVFVTDEK